MKQIILSLLICSAVFIQAQTKVKFVNNRLDSNVKVYVTYNIREADKVVFITSKTQYRQRGVWQLVKNRLDADLLIFETTLRSDADIVVYYTNNINLVR